jgi:hypothetical protein
MLEEIGFADIVIGPSVDTFGGARGEANARTFEVFGYAFLAHKPHIIGAPPAHPGQGPN